LAEQTEENRRTKLVAEAGQEELVRHVALEQVCREAGLIEENGRVEHMR